MTESIEERSNRDRLTLRSMTIAALVDGKLDTWLGADGTTTVIAVTTADDERPVAPVVLKETGNGIGVRVQYKGREVEVCRVDTKEDFTCVITYLGGLATATHAPWVQATFRIMDEVRYAEGGEFAELANVLEAYGEGQSWREGVDYYIESVWGEMTPERARSLMEGYFEIIRTGREQYGITVEAAKKWAGVFTKWTEGGQDA